MSTARSSIDEWPWPLVVKTHPRARHLKLRLDTKRGEVVLTCPPRSSRKRAIAWAETQGQWVKEQVEAVPQAEPIADGSCLPFDGSELLIDHDPDRSRACRIVGNRLVCGGPSEGLSRLVETFLRKQARTILSNETAGIAARARVKIKSVSVGDAGTRWGSCSAEGALRYNWRLVMAPPDVRKWVVAHEVAHRVHMNHGPAFHALEAELFDGDCKAARSALRRIGPRLKRIGLTR